MSGEPAAPRAAGAPAPSAPDADRPGLGHLHVLVHGAVQGVGFRRFVQRTAESLGAGGWVRNRRDGAVEVRATGHEDAITALRQACATGPRRARVARVHELSSTVAGLPQLSSSSASTFLILPDS